MNTRKLLASTALATSLLIAGSLPAAAGPTIDLGGYGGSVQLNFADYESFLTASGGVSTTPAIGDTNFGIFVVGTITPAGNLADNLWVSGDNGNNNDELVGVFTGINVTNVTVSGSTETTTNSGGIFQLYLIPKSATSPDLGLAGYTTGGCSAIGGLCYNGITDGQLVLTMDLTPGGVAPSPTTLVGTLQAGVTPATGSAIFDGTISGDSQFLPDATGKDSFCGNTGNCPGQDSALGLADPFAIASQDPIIATAVPEPASVGLLGMALLGFGGFGWFRRRKQAGTAGFAM